MKNLKITFPVLLILIVTFLTDILSLQAQPPQKMSYQAVVRNASNQLIVNQVVGMKISILKGSENGSSVYTETQKPTANANGLVTIEIGSGTTSDDFSVIDWANGPYYIKTSTDPSGGANYTISGVSQLLSVPYALYAQTTGNTTKHDGDTDSTNEIQNLSISGNILSLSKSSITVTLPTGADNWGTQTAATNTTLEGNGTTATPLKIAQQGALNGQVLKWNGTTWKPGNVDADTTNEVQKLSISGSNLSLSKGGGTVMLPSSSGGGGDNWGTQTAVTNSTLEGNGTTATPLKIAQQSATTGQALKWNGTSWAPGTDIASGSIAGGDLSGTYPNPTVTKIQGVSVNNTAPSAGQVLKYNGSSWGPSTISTGLTLPYRDSASFTITPFSIENAGSSWYTIAGSGNTGYGIYGSTKGTNTAGVLGMGTGTSYSMGVLGMTGEGNSTGIPGNTGVLGLSAANIGVAGTSLSGTGGYFSSNSGTALQTIGSIKMTGIGEANGKVLTSDAAGIATWQDPTGLTLPYNGSISNTNPAFQVTNNGSGEGIKSVAISSGATGIIGEAPNQGILGNAIATTGPAYGVQGTSASSTGSGVTGYGSSSTGQNFGVRGLTSSDEGKGVYGLAASLTGANYGVYGESASDAGTGIYGTSPNIAIEGIGTGMYSYGLFGQSYFVGAEGYASAGNGTTYGVLGTSISTSGTGVYGSSTASSGTTYGVYGASSSTAGSGVYGINSSSSGTNYGVYGSSYSNFGYGIYGKASNCAVKGEADYYGVIGQANADNGIGVYGMTFGANGYAGYFLGRLSVTGNVGIGTASPAFSLDVAGPLNLNKGIVSGPALYVNSSEAIWYNGTYYSWGYGGSWNYFGDKIFIGAVAADPGANMLVVNGAAAKPGGGSWATWSDSRLKDIHGNYEKGLKEIIALQPVKFNYKVGNACNLPSDQNYVGFVAQDVQKVFPEAVSEGKDGYLTLDVNAINVALVNAIKELKAENNELNARLTKLEKLMEANDKK